MAVPSLSQGENAHKQGENIKAGVTPRSRAKVLLGELTYRLPIFFVLSIIFAILIISFFYIPNTRINSVPYPLHSYLIADYSADPHNMLIPVLEFELVQEFIHDQASFDPDELYEALVINLQTPVLTVTQLSLLTATPTIPFFGITSTVPTENYTPTTTTSQSPDDTATAYVTILPTGTQLWEPTHGATRIPTHTPNSSQHTVTALPTSQATKSPATPTQAKPTTSKTQSPPSATQPKPTATKTSAPPTQPPPPTKPPEPYPPPTDPNPTPPPPYP